MKVRLILIGVGVLLGIVIFSKTTDSDHDITALTPTPTLSDQQNEIIQAKQENDNDVKNSVYDACSGNDINSALCRQAIITCQNNDSCSQMVNTYQASSGNQEVQPSRETFVLAALVFVNQQRQQMGLPLLDNPVSSLNSINPTLIPNSSIPQGATAKCVDGTYSFSQHRQGTCSHHGGVAQWL